MWYIHTKQGTFWIIEPDMGQSTYTLGIGEDFIAEYPSPEQAVESVQHQETGYEAWDCAEKVKIPGTLASWKQGKPKDWA